MSIVTPQQLAQHARQLADELERGEGPTLGRDQMFTQRGPCCVLGHVASRASVDAVTLYEETYSTYAVLHELLGDAAPANMLAEFGNVIHANDSASSDERPRAVIAPLRALADALEAR